MANSPTPNTKRQWSASEENSYYTGRGLVLTGIILVIGGFAIEACGIPSPVWVEKVMLMLFGGILTAYNTRPEGRSQSLELKSEGNPPAQLSATAGASDTSPGETLPATPNAATTPESRRGVNGP